MDKVFVTLIGDAIAVNVTERGATDTLTAIIHMEAGSIMNQLYDRGEIRKTLKIRSALVELGK